MYPVDLLKVCANNARKSRTLPPADRCHAEIDSNANPSSLRKRLVYRFNECRVDDLPNRGLADVMEGRFERHRGCGYGTERRLR